MTEPALFRYRAFISYAHRDASAAKWLHRGIERFRIDKDLIGRESPLGPIPETLAPVFRDRDEFTAGHSLTQQTLEALNASAALIVICSPAAAASRYVNEEIRLFRHHHPERPVIPLIVDGKPGDPDAECFPPALRFQLDADGAITDQPNEVLAADWREAADGRELARAKIIARLLGLGTDDVYRRAERARRRANRIRAGVAASLLLLASGGGIATKLYIDSREQVISYDTALERYCRDYLEKVREQCDRQDLEGTFRRIAEAAAAGRDPRNRKILQLLDEGRAEEAAALMRELAAEEAARGEAQIERAAERYRDTGRIAFLTDTQAAIQDYLEAVRLDPDNPEGWNELGLLQLRTGLLDKAEQSFQRVLKLANRKEQTENADMAYAGFVAAGNLGEVYLTRGELARAREIFERQLSMAKALGLKEAQARAAGRLGSVHTLRGDFDRAEEVLRLALSIAKEWGNKKLQAAATGNLGLLYFKRGKLDEAESMQLKSLDLYQDSESSPQDIASAIGVLGQIYFKRGELDRAEETLSRARELAKSLDVKEQEAQISGSLGLIYLTRGQLDQAEELFRRYLKLSEEIGAKEGQAGALSSLGEVYFRRGQLDRSKRMHERQLELAEALGQPELQANALGNLGVIYRTQGELDRAETMHARQLQLANKSGQKELEANAANNLAVIYIRRGDLGRAEPILKHQLALSNDIRDKEQQADVYGKLGSIYQQNGEISRAEQMFTRQLEIAKAIGSKPHELTSTGSLSVIYSNRGELSRAEKMLRRQIDLAGEVGNKKRLAAASANLGLIYKQQNDLARACTYFAKAYKLMREIGLPLATQIEGWMRDTDCPDT